MRLEPRCGGPHSISPSLNTVFDPGSARKGLSFGFVLAGGRLSLNPSYGHQTASLWSHPTIAHNSCRSFDFPVRRAKETSASVRDIQKSVHVCERRVIADSA